MDEETVRRLINEIVVENFEDYASKSLSFSCLREENARAARHLNEKLHGQGERTQTLEKILQEALQSIAQAHVQIEALSKKTTAIETDVEHKAYTDQVNLLEKELSFLSPKSDIDYLIKTIRNSATSSDLQAIKETVEDLDHRLISSYISREDARQEFQRMQRQFMDTCENFPSKEELQATSNKLFKKSAEIDNILENFRLKNEHKWSSIKDNLHTVRKLVDGKANNDVVENLSQKIELKGNESDFKRAHEEITSKVNSFHSELVSVNRVLMEQEQSILKLDEGILTKATKQEFKDLVYKVNSISKHVEIEDKIDSMVEQLNYLNNSFEENASELRKLRSQVLEMMSFYSRKQFEASEMKNLKDVLIEMQGHLTNKADRVEILNYLEQKAGWADFHHLNGAMEDIHSQVKMTAVHFEALRRIIADPHKVRGTERSQREYLEQISKKMIDYIVQTSPTKEHHPLPDELTDFLHLSDKAKIEQPKSSSQSPARKNK